MMKVASASKADIDAALRLLGILDALSRGYYPSVAEEGADAPLYFDDDNSEHLHHLWVLIRQCLDAAPGFQGRVIFGAATLMDPANEVLDPNCDVIELHPRLREALKDVDRLNHILASRASAGQGAGRERLDLGRKAIDVELTPAPGDGKTE